jgi:hypothetical protein
MEGSGRVSGAEPRLTEGWVAEPLRAEFPQLRLWSVRVTAAPRRSPPEVRERLRALSDRMHGARAVALRGEPVPHAHRVFFRHVGLDPDVQRVPAEEALVERLLHGGYRSHGLPADALLVALVETGVAVWAVDAERMAEPLELRAEAGRLVVAGAAGAIAPLFAPPPAELAPDRRTRALLLYAVQVPGVPDLFVEEAVWTCVELLE